MKESEAKQKWCPFTRFHMVGTQQHSNKPFREDVAPLHCIASDCMAWQETAQECINPSQPPNAGVTYKYVPAGYCGLAGKGSV